MRADRKRAVGSASPWAPQVRPYTSPGLRCPSGTDGFALPVAIFAVVVVGFLVTGGFFVAQQETRIGYATEAGTRVFYLAERAIGEVVETWDNPRFMPMPMWASDTVSGTFVGAEWEVQVRKIGTQHFFLNARARSTEGGQQYGGAERRVGMLMRLRTIQIDVPGALTTQGDVSTSGNARIDGADRDPSGWDDWCPEWLDGGAGVTSTDGSQLNRSGNSTVAGEPPFDTDPSINDETFTLFGDLAWDDLVALANIQHLGGAIFDQIAPRLNAEGDCDTTHAMNWGDAEDPNGQCFHYFPVIHIQGNANTQGGGHGQGILLVDGDLHLEGGFDFYGLIIVQGKVTASGGGGNAPTVQGGVLAANTEGNVQLFDGASQMLYSTCAIQRALTGANQLVDPWPIVERSWVDVTAISF